MLVYFDDVLIYSKSWTEHLEKLEEVLGILREHSFFAKKSKCSFVVDRIEFLGFIVSRQGVSLDPKKVEAVKAWKVPTNLKELRSFLGMASYLRRSIEGFARKAAPMTDLLKKGTFEWNPIAQESFERVKSALISAPTLKLPNFDLPFEIETDACDVGVGAMLRQGHGVIAYESWKLKSSEVRYPTHEKEMLTIVFTLK